VEDRGTHANVRLPNPWVTGSLVLMLRLMLMVLKGLYAHVADHEACARGEMEPISDDASNGQPSVGAWRHSRLLNEPTGDISVRVSPELSDVASVELQHTEEQAVALFTDSVKIFADFTGAWPTEVSKHACHSLHSVLRSVTCTCSKSQPHVRVVQGRSASRIPATSLGIRAAHPPRDASHEYRKRTQQGVRIHPTRAA
jgi:hypothetical protein